MKKQLTRTLFGVLAVSPLALAALGAHAGASAPRQPLVDAQGAPAPGNVGQAGRLHHDPLGPTMERTSARWGAGPNMERTSERWGAGPTMERTSERWGAGPNGRPTLRPPTAADLRAAGLSEDQIRTALAPTPARPTAPLLRMSTSTSRPAAVPLRAATGEPMPGNCMGKCPPKDGKYE
jgi:hypothetical protein